jgi:hypothetical protein
MWLEQFLAGHLLKCCVARTDDEWKAKLGAKLHHMTEALNIATQIRAVLLQQRDKLQTDPGEWLTELFGPFFAVAVRG